MKLKKKEEDWVESRKNSGCLNSKDEYHSVISGQVRCNCAYCSIPMSQCEYWQNRQKDKPINNDRWQDCLLEKK